MSGDSGPLRPDHEEEAIEAGVTAASEAVSCLAGRGRRWAA
jgi:hypothetical protein